MLQNVLLQSSPSSDLLDGMDQLLGISFFDDEIDQVIFQTNQFLVGGGADNGGPFFWIMQFSLTLGALFAVIMASGMAYKMMVKGEPFDPLKLFRVLGIALVMFFWYGESLGSTAGSGVLDVLAYAPNAIGSWTHQMYEAEALQVQGSFELLKEPLQTLNDSIGSKLATYESSKNTVVETNTEVAGEVSDVKTQRDADAKVHYMKDLSSYAHFVVTLDKLVMILSLVIFRIGWWGTIFCQQILLGMLTIFGPLMWAFSVLPKWEGAWAKWITRYLTVHFYGAMLYFVGFYVLLLIDIVINIQYDMLSNIIESNDTILQYLTHAMTTAGYLLVASVVSLKCLNLVPDLAAWVIPEGDTAFSTRNFGEGVSSGVKQSASSVVTKMPL